MKGKVHILTLSKARRSRKRRRRRKRGDPKYKEDFSHRLLSLTVLWSINKTVDSTT